MIQVELDLHADTTIVSPNVLVVHDHECYVDVCGYDSKSRHKNTANVNAAIPSNNPQTGDTLVLLINQAILILSVKNIFLSPMLSHLNSVSVNVMPKFLLKNPMVNDYTVIIPSDTNDSPC